ncbi:MAG: glutamyl-tRNA amidotransferase [Gammaproteobacteria bacterium]|nr:glutamyl-tRNA amidotransferase [Gammaproteobacteria bacterium]
MSSNPEEESEPVAAEDSSAVKRGTQYEQRDPEADARAAIERGDLRLLGFATRVTSLPGVVAEDKEAALAACGVRLLEGFGDVIRSDEELAAMQQASAYAKRYNAVMLGVCLGDK